MNYYLDLEATQFTGKILSIGCICENGNTFYSLMKPKGKNGVTKFITALTGITKEMIKCAPSPDEAFGKFQEFVRVNSNGEETFFYAYGDGDKEFIRHTCGDINNKQIRKFAVNLYCCIGDYSVKVREYFQLGKHAISLKKAVEYFEQQEIIQNHNALEDAEMLKEIADRIEGHDPLSECPWPELLLPPEEREPQPVDYLPIYIETKTGIQEFANRFEAGKYIYYHLFTEHTRKECKIKSVNYKLRKCILNNLPYCGYEWKIKEKEEPKEEEMEFFVLL